QPFGGLSVILLRDFHQFPPVAAQNHALYSQNPRSARCQLGRNIYAQFNTVIKLHQQNRIRDTIWCDILQRARTGTCTDDDLQQIRSLVLMNETCIVPDFSCAPWSDAILITPRNSVQTRWNARAIEKHSMLSGEIMYICPAEDSTGGSPLSPSQRLTIAAVPLKDTEQLPTMIRIVKGMRVMVTRNISTAANLSNGSRGRIADLILDPREAPIGQSAIEQRRTYLHYPPILVIIELDFCELPQLPGLPPRHVPLSPISSKFTVGSNPLIRVT
ncbi:hypothetical protein M405DRAFT_925298, partial [Rhizopogon salebrosus TDB-379]